MRRNIFYFNKGTENTFLNTIKILLKDIKRLEIERKLFFNKYCENPSMDNIAIFYSRAKHIEQMMILSIVSEYIIKAVLLKYNFIINGIKKNLKFNNEFVFKLTSLKQKGVTAGSDLIKEVDELADKDIVAELDKKTISFEECRQIFEKHIAIKGYFNKTPEYIISNDYTKEFYGDRLSYPTMFKTLQDVRNNYGHVPEVLYEENGILPFMYNFLVYIVKKEFPDFFSKLNYFMDKPIK